MRNPGRPRATKVKWYLEVSHRFGRFPSDVGYTQVRVPRRKVKANPKPAKLLHKLSRSLRRKTPGTKEICGADRPQREYGSKLTPIEEVWIFLT